MYFKNNNPIMIGMSTDSHGEEEIASEGSQSKARGGVGSTTVNFGYECATKVPKFGPYLRIKKTKLISFLRPKHEKRHHIQGEEMRCVTTQITATYA